MTTIAYSHSKQQIACDSRINRGGIIMTDVGIKWVYKGTDLIFFAGSVCDIEAYLENNRVGVVPQGVIELDALMVRDGIVYECSFCKTAGYWQLPLKYDTAIGSGRDFAIAALDFDKTAVEAVEYAKTRDLYTGGVVRFFNLITMAFEDAPNGYIGK